MKKQTLPDRKIIRLAEYDYNVDGVYFITICAKNREKIFSEIKTEKHSDGSVTVNVELTEVGKTAEKYILSSERIDGVKIDDYVIMPNHIHIIVALECSGSKNCGTSRAPSHMASLRNNAHEFSGGTSRAPSPTASLCNNADEFNGGTSRAPSPMVLLCNNADEFNGGTSRAPSPTASLCNNADEFNGGTSRAPSPTASHTPANAKLPRVIAAFKRLCNKETGYNVFQRSYMEHIIRDFDDYVVRKNYITNNPIRWIEDKYYI